MSRRPPHSTRFGVIPPFIAAVALAFSIGLSASAAGNESKPNIVIILTDDAGYVDFGFTGSTMFPTPHIDRLAAEGVVCTQGYVTASVCSPSRAGLLTGRYQQRFGHEFNLPGLSKMEDGGLPLSQKTIADLLRARGYRTGAIGKWHQGLADKFHPLERGFDEFYGYLGGSRSYFPYEKKPRRANRAMRDREEVPDPPGGYVTDTLAKEACAFIERNHERPFFLYLSFTAVHGPMHAKEGLFGRFASIEPVKRRKLAAMTAALDDAVGAVLAKLVEHELDESTLIIFLNDNGGATNNASDNGPWRGMKGSKFEGGVRVPFAVRWPKRLAGGGTFDEPVSALDVLPTCVAAAGQMPDDLVTDGVDLLPFFDGAKEGRPHEMLFWRRGVAAAARRDRWKLIRIQDRPPLLFDLAADPGETTNIAESNSEAVESLLAALAEWEEEMIEPVWGQDDVWSRNQINKHRMDVKSREAERKLP
jgi:arylsulfatase A-like enzyme